MIVFDHLENILLYKDDLLFTTERKVLNTFGNLISLTNTLIFRLQIEKLFWFEPFGGESTKY